MVQIIDFGYKLPELSDKDFWDSYNFDIVRLSTHNHDGINSALLAPGHFAPQLVLVETADWTGPVDGLYSYTIPLPSNVTWPTGNPCPVLVKGFEGDELVLVSYSRVDDDNLQVTSRSNDDLVVGLY